MRPSPRKRSVAPDWVRQFGVALQRLSRKPLTATLDESPKGTAGVWARLINKRMASLGRQLEKAKNAIVRLRKQVSEIETSKGQIKESMGELLKFHHLSEAISASHDVEGVLDSLLQLSASVVPITASGVFLLDRQGKALQDLRVRDLSQRLRDTIQEQLEEGVIDWVIRERFPAVVPDIESLSAGDTGEQEFNFIIIPLIVRGRGIGVYHIYTQARPSGFTLQQLELLSLLSNVAAVAIENSQLYEQMNRTIKELAALYETGKKVNSVLKPDQLYQTAAQTVCEKLGVGLGWIFECRTGGELLLRASQGNARLRLDGPSDPFREVIKLREPHLFDSTGLRKFAKVFGEASVESLIAVPLFYHDRLGGIVAVASRSGEPALERSHLGLLRTMANQVSIALENSKLYLELLQANQNLTEMQGQLIHSGKLAALGQLAGGVAHEINNPLQIILGRVQMVMMETQDASQRDELGIIESETKRIASIVRGLLEFARDGEKPVAFKVLDLNQALRDSFVLIRHQLDVEEIRIVEEYKEGIPRILGDPGMLKQVFLNICINAKQAMKPGDTFTLRSGFDDRYVFVEFADTGAGIASEYLGRIFEPFFTTKEENGGTGLGLSISYNIVQKHNGLIQVKSQKGKGSTFRVCLPPLTA